MEGDSNESPSISLNKEGLAISSPIGIGVRYTSISDMPKSKKRPSRRVAVIDRKKEDGINKEWVTGMKTYSKQRPDPYQGDYEPESTSGLKILQPTYNPSTLLTLPNRNNVLRQCIDAMQTNIECFGHSFEYVGPEDLEQSTEAKNELARLEMLTKMPNEEYGLIEMRKRFRSDYESIGYGAFEVARDSKNNIIAFYHVDAHTLRKTTMDEEEVIVETELPGVDGDIRKVKTRKKFRRYVQIFGEKKNWFKEYGDPRVIDPATGKVDSNMSPEDGATEIIFRDQYEAGHAYGLPRWINQLPCILGSREAELTNLHFFEDNAIPAMAILVSGGFLSEDTIEDLEAKFNGGGDNLHKVLILEAESSDDDSGIEGASKATAPRLDIKPLAGERQSDALFQEYDENCQNKIRGSFRFGPIFVGRSDDYTRATAQSSLDTAESQVFAPERVQIDDIFNYKLLVDEKGSPPRYWRFRSNPARIVGAEYLIETLSTMEEVGAMTPNIAIGVINSLFNLNRKPIEDTWGDYPFTLLRDMVSKDREATGIPDLAEAVDIEPSEEEESESEEPQEIARGVKPNIRIRKRK